MTEYRRYQGKSYMILHTDVSADGYEYSMLIGNGIAGLMQVQIMALDGHMQFWYDISGRQTLEDWMKIKNAGSSFLGKFLAALAKTVRNAGKYLLPEDGISLAPEKIFVDTEEKEIVFCYMPFEKRDFAESLCGFMEYYIAHMQHDSRMEAQKCYEVYEKSQQGNTELEKMLEILFEKEEEEVWQKMPEQQIQESFFVKEKPSFFHRNKKIKRKFAFQKKRPAAQEYVFAPEECEEKFSNQTVFLGSETDQIIGELKYEGDGCETNLKINASVFLIGSQEKETDGVITDDTVSRIHARITKEADDYYLEDMNSTNGTYCNGERLNYKEKVRLEKNDRISFAKESYRFV